MTDPRLASPASMLLWLAGATLGAVLLATALGLGTWAASAPATAAWGAALRLSLAVAAASGVAAMLMLADVLRRTLPLYRSATRPGGPTPPSEAALRDAFGAPGRVVIALVLTAGGVILADALGLPGAAVLEGGGGSGLRLLLFAAIVGAATPLSVLTERILAVWQRPFPPEEMLGPPRRPLARWFGVRVGLPVAAAVLAPAGLSVAGGDGDSPAFAASAALLVGCATGAAAGVLASRWGETLERDAVTLFGRLEGQASSSTVISLAADLRERSLVSLATALAGLAGRFGETVHAEDEARRIVQQMQRQKMLFMASMSHDLRSPLNSILGFSELLESGVAGELTSGQRESVLTVRRSGEELLRLLNDVLDSARFEVGRLPLRPEWTPSVEILTEAVRRGRELIAGTELEIAVELQPGLPPVYVDSDRIVQAVVGIFRHAARAMKHGTIRLRASVAADADGEEQVRVVIADRSAGIRADDRERIFQAFREVAEPSGRRIGGLGLGLSLARELVCAHGGDVWCESREHHGTTFTVALPVTGPDPASPDPA